jgi:hypothetical protein
MAYYHENPEYTDYGNHGNKYSKYELYSNHIEPDHYEHESTPKEYQHRHEESEYKGDEVQEFRYEDEAVYRDGHELGELEGGNEYESRALEYEPGYNMEAQYTAYEPHGFDHGGGQTAPVAFDDTPTTFEGAYGFTPTTDNPIAYHSPHSPTYVPPIPFPSSPNPPPIPRSN